MNAGHHTARPWWFNLARWVGVPVPPDPAPLISVELLSLPREVLSNILLRAACTPEQRACYRRVCRRFRDLIPMAWMPVGRVSTWPDIRRCWMCQAACKKQYDCTVTVKRVIDKYYYAYLCSTACYDSYLLMILDTWCNGNPACMDISITEPGCYLIKLEGLVYPSRPDLLQRVLKRRRPETLLLPSPLP